MKIYLDDERPAPPGWTRCYWPEEVIEFLQQHQVQAISLDHDLGNDKRGTGYDVILWIENQVATAGFKPPVIYIHSANTSAKKKMLAGVKNIYTLANNQR